MRKLAVFFTITVMMFVLTSCGSSVDETQYTNKAEYEKSILELGEANIITKDSGENVVVVEAIYTNNDSEPLYALSAFAVRAFQNDIQLIDVSDINGDEASLVQEVRDGQSISVTYVFLLEDNSPIELLIGEPTAEQTTIGKQIYFDNDKK